MPLIKKLIGGRSKNLLIAFFALLAFHAALFLNKTYTVTLQDSILLNKVSNEEYHLYINSVDKDLRISLIQDTTVNFFGIIPYWASYIVIAGYFVILLLFAYQPSKSTERYPLLQPVKKEGESLELYAKRIADWQSELEKDKLKQEAIDELKELALEVRIAMQSIQSKMNTSK